MLGQRHEIARLQSDFYRDSYYKALRMLMVTMVIILLLIAAIIYVVIFQPPPRYYATTTTGQIIPMVATVK